MELKVYRIVSYDNFGFRFAFKDNCQRINRPLNTVTLTTQLKTSDTSASFHNSVLIALTTRD